MGVWLVPGQAGGGRMKKKGWQRGKPGYEQLSMGGGGKCNNETLPNCQIQRWGGRLNALWNTVLEPHLPLTYPAPMPKDQSQFSPRPPGNLSPGEQSECRRNVGEGPEPASNISSCSHMNVKQRNLKQGDICVPRWAGRGARSGHRCLCGHCHLCKGQRHLGPAPRSAKGRQPVKLCCQKS